MKVWTHFVLVCFLNGTGAALANDNFSASPQATVYKLVADSSDDEEQLVSYRRPRSCPCCPTPQQSVGCCQDEFSSPGWESGAGVGQDMGMGQGLGSDDPQGYGYLADSFGAGRGAYGSEPGMIGDFFGAGYSFTSVYDSTGPNVFPNNTQPQRGATIPIAGGDRRFKIADNNSPIPTDRVFFNFHHFQNAVVRFDNGTANLDRYTFGVEKTFRDGLWSVELRTPIVGGLNTDQLVDGTNRNFQSTELGNVGVAFKRLLHRGDMLTVATGLGVILPTGDDVRLFSAPGIVAVTFNNEAYYLQPFMGFFITPNENLFAQLGMQADFDARGNSMNVAATGPGVDGVLQDQTLLYLDASVGYWIYRSPYGRVTGLAPIVELHHTTTLQNADRVASRSPAFTVTNVANRMDVLNMTLGFRTEFGGGTSYLTVAAVSPLRGNSDEFFDTELGIQFTRFF